MNRPRQPGTIEAAIAQAIGDLGIDGISQAIGKTESMVRNFADPDDEHHIQFRHAIAIDIACDGTPMADAGRRMVEAATRKPATEQPGRAYFILNHNVGILGRIIGGGDLDGPETAEIIDFIRRDLDSMEAASEPGLRAVK